MRRDGVGWWWWVGYLKTIWNGTVFGYIETFILACFSCIATAHIGNINASDSLLIYKIRQWHIQFCNIGIDQAMNDKIKCGICQISQCCGNRTKDSEGCVWKHIFTKEVVNIWISKRSFWWCTIQTWRFAHVYIKQRRLMNYCDRLKIPIPLGSDARLSSLPQFNPHLHVFIQSFCHRTSLILVPDTCWFKGKSMLIIWYEN